MGWSKTAHKRSCKQHSFSAELDREERGIASTAQAINWGKKEGVQVQLVVVSWFLGGGQRKVAPSATGGVKQTHMNRN
eukprot:m.213275 g.213275  ORF g.213275 m.213275 type:complete len:78 (-) comp15083_c2_seq2:3881-4114(-)